MLFPWPLYLQTSTCPVADLLVYPILEMITVEGLYRDRISTRSPEFNKLFLGLAMGFQTTPCFPLKHPLNTLTSAGAARTLACLCATIDQYLTHVIVFVGRQLFQFGILRPTLALSMYCISAK